MAVALLSSHPEFVRLPSGHWALATDHGLASRVSADTAGDGAPAEGTASGSLRDVNFAVVDVETTGTSPTAGDKITRSPSRRCAAAKW